MNTVTVNACARRELCGYLIVLSQYGLPGLLGMKFLSPGVVLPFLDALYNTRTD